MSKDLFNFDKPNFSQQFGTGTLSEQRGDNKKNVDTAGIINASANGLDSLGGFISTFTGKPQNSQQNYNAPPPPTKKKVNPLVVGGVIGGVVLIILIIVLNNGKAAPES